MFYYAPLTDKYININQICTFETRGEMTAFLRMSNGDTIKIISPSEIKAIYNLISPRGEDESPKPAKIA
jgi:hypothetical protein